MPIGSRVFISVPSGVQQTSGAGPRSCALTVKLRGRTATPDRRRGPTISTGSRGANQTTRHGPLQRLLDGVVTLGKK